MEEMKRRYDTVNEKLWNLETRMDTMSKEQAESSGAIRFKLYVLLRNSIAQDKLMAGKPFGTRVDFVEPQRMKRNLYRYPGLIAAYEGCIDTWIEVMRLHLEQNNLNDERQACTAILSNLEGTALKCVVAKKEEERDTADNC